MTDIVIRAENLGKRYRMGERRGYLTLRDALAHALRAPVRFFQARERGWRNGDPTHFWAIKDVSFEVHQGEIIGIIGRNGAGKTTLLKILARVTRPTEGRAQVKGRVGSLLEVGTGFHPELTGRENVFLSGAILGMSKAEILRKFDEIVAFAEFERFLDTPLKHYSSGMQMRLAFSVAAHLQPEILLVDEVLAVGDAAFQKKCLGKMAGVASEGRTVLFVIHNISAVRSLCARGLLVDEGHLVFSGAVWECIDRYLSSAGELPSCINTNALPRPPNVAADRTLRIQHVRLETGQGTAILHAGQPLELVMEFNLSSPIDDLVLGYSVHSADGVRIVECRSTDAYGSLPRLEPGSYAVECSIPNFLNEGLYSLHAGARCGAKLLDTVPEVMAFRVDPGERLDSLWLQATKGLLRLPSRWTPPILVQERGGSFSCP